MRRTAVIMTLLVSLSGCGWSKQITADTASLGDRCAHVMQAAMPWADLDIGGKSSRSPDIRTIIATAQATRADTPPGSASDRDLAAECTFTDSVLTAFRWTKGAPEARP
jgi:hypothetical protein